MAVRLTENAKKAMIRFREASKYMSDTELVDGRVWFIPALYRISVIKDNGSVETYNNPTISKVAEIVSQYAD